MSSAQKESAGKVQAMKKHSLWTLHLQGSVDTQYWTRILELHVHACIAIHALSSLILPDQMGHVHADIFVSIHVYFN